AVGPDFEPPAPPPSGSDYRAQGESVPPQAALGQRIRGEWWRLFRSPDLDGVIVRALDGNQELAAAKATLAQVREQTQADAGILYPQLGVQGGLTREKVNFTSFGLNFPST